MIHKHIYIYNIYLLDIHTHIQKIKFMSYPIFSTTWNKTSAPPEADRLLMTFRLASAWLLSLLTTIFLHEILVVTNKNVWWVVIFGASFGSEFWKWTWKVWGVFLKEGKCAWWFEGLKLKVVFFLRLILKVNTAPVFFVVVGIRWCFLVIFLVGYIIP